MKGGPGKPVELNGLERVAVLVESNSSLMLAVEVNGYRHITDLISNW